MSLSHLFAFTAVSAIASAGAVPILVRALTKKRAPLASRWTIAHAWIGALAGIAAGAHAVCAIPSLDAGADDVLMISAALSFLVLVMHAGFGQSLRNPKLRRRPERRRAHLTTAIALTLVVAAHVAYALHQRSQVG